MRPDKVGLQLFTEYQPHSSTADLLEQHLHIWPQIGDAALLFASLLHAVTPELDRTPISKLSVELRKIWLAHPKNIGAHLLSRTATWTRLWRDLAPYPRRVEHAVIMSPWCMLKITHLEASGDDFVYVH